MDCFDRSIPEDGRVYGFLLATVLANNSDEPKGTLKLNLLCEGENSVILEGVKVVAPFAGKSYGVYMLPEVGEKVVVGFLEGCVNKPFVLGSVYTVGDSMISESYNKDNCNKRVKTKSGTLIEISDEKDAPSITLKTPNKLELEMKEKTESIKITTGDTLMEIDGKNGKITVKGQKELLLESGGAKLSMKSSGVVEIKGTHIEIKADSGIMLTSGGMLETKANGILTLKGSLIKAN